MGDQLIVVNTTDPEHTLSTVTVCAREQWDESQTQLVGHGATVVVARYSHRVFGNKDDEDVALVRLPERDGRAAHLISFCLFEGEVSKPR
jgi:hypothetical protein